MTSIHPLTSLRLLFALMVFASHCNIVSDSFDIPILTEGYVGVSFFFVLSGFIISYSYDERFLQRSVTAYDFFTARVARIYPLHWLMLLITVALGTYTLDNGLADWMRHFVANLLLCQAYVPDAGYYFSFNSPSWSLCCEQLFYLCFPLMTLLLRHPRRLQLLFVLCAIAVVTGMHLTPTDMAKGIWYVNPLARFPDFILGMMVYMYYRKERTSGTHSHRHDTLFEFAAILLFVVFYAASPHIPQVYRYSCYYWLPIAGIIYVFARQGGMVSRWLSTRWLTLGGEVSFGFYLIHHLLFRLYVEAERYFHLSLSPLLAVLLILFLTLLLSVMSFYLFERPMNKQVKRIALFFRKNTQ